MTKSFKFLATASALGTIALAATPSFATGVIAGTNVTNEVTVTYQVGGVAQNALTAQDTFKVDRKINLLVAEVGNVTTSVSPGQSNAVTTFTVTNSSNSPIDIGLAATQLSGGTAKHGGTDTFNVTGLTIYRDHATNGTAGVYDPGVDVAITYLDEVAADATITVYLVGAVPLGLANGSVAGVRLTGTAQGNVSGTDGAYVATPGSLAAVLVEDTGANVNGTIQTVFADTKVTGGNTARNGIDFDEDDYTVAAPVLTVTKLSKVISDPLNLTTNPKMIPGATVEYCIVVANGAGGATATNVNISDIVPAQTTYVASSIWTDSTVTSGACDNPSGTQTGTSYDGGTTTVTAPLSNIAAGASRGVRFRVTIN